MNRADYWRDRRTLVTGSQGFIGTHCITALRALGAKVPDITGADFSDLEDARELCQGIDTVIHLAAHVGGIGYASNHQHEMLADNIRLNTAMLQAAEQAQVKTFVLVSSACVYPDLTPNPMTEEWGWSNEPVEASRGYGWAKRIAEISGSLFGKWTPMRVVIPRGFNAYGPGDKLDPSSSHVIPAILEKTKALGPIELWGSGIQVRSFTYVTDWVDALLFMAQYAPSGVPINLSGDDKGIAIADLASLILKATGDERTLQDIRWQIGPEGHQVRVPDITWLKNHNWKPLISLEEGIQRTVEWWRQS